MIYMFGDIDEVKTAERNLRCLRQKGSVANYTVEFQQYATVTNQDDDALCSQYYKGLKDIVKDEFAKIDRLDTLSQLIIAVVKIDN